LPANLSAACSGADLCLAGGQDLVGNLDYEEGTLEELENEYDQRRVDEREYIELLKKGTNEKF
jgi:hypothetical protein